MDDQMPFAQQGLSDLVASRLCHDLSNPLGAIGNGVELLSMTGEANGPEMALIEDAVADALARVRFYRLAFGHAGPGQRTSAREASEALSGLYRRTRLVPEWHPETDLSRRVVKIAYLAVLCAETALPMGGHVRLTVSPQDSVFLEAEAERIQIDEPLWSVLRFGPEAAGRALRAAEAHFFALHDVAASGDLKVAFIQAGGTLSITVG